MMRATVIWIGLASVACIGVFAIKLDVQNLEERLAAVQSDIRRDQEAIHVLKAEWAYLNQPSRLEALARRYLKLTRPEPGQVAGFAAIPERPPEDSPKSNGTAGRKPDPAVHQPPILASTGDRP